MSGGCLQEVVAHGGLTLFDLRRVMVKNTDLQKSLNRFGCLNYLTFILCLAFFFISYQDIGCILQSYISILIERK